MRAPMAKAHVAGCVILTSLSLSLSAIARDQDSASSELVAAERAYQEVDFAAMHEHATRGLALGLATRDETCRLYVLAGMSAAATGDATEAKQAFIVALGINPGLKLDRNLSPKIRGPYLEAQGFWGAHAEHLDVQARISGDGERLSVHLVDPAHLGFKVELRERAIGERSYDSLAERAKGTVVFAVSERARSRGVEYFIRLVDKEGNTLAEVGGEDEPRVERRGAKPAPTGVERKENARAGSTRSYLWPTVFAVAGAGAVGAGVLFHLRREQDAKEWNASPCEQPNLSRIEQCGEVDSRRRRDELIAIGAYGLGGVLLAGSAIWLVAGKPTTEPNREGLLGCGIQGPGIGCRGRF
jgi:hypothetical protein